LLLDEQAVFDTEGEHLRRYVEPRNALPLGLQTKDMDIGQAYRLTVTASNFEPFLASSVASLDDPGAKN
jgi:hypothetical protein